MAVTFVHLAIKFYYYNFTISFSYEYIKLTDLVELILSEPYYIQPIFMSLSPTFIKLYKLSSLLVTKFVACRPLFQILG